MYDAEYVGNISKINKRNDLQLITDSQEIKEIKSHLGNPDWFDFNGCFVSVKDGDYDELYCFDGIVPYLDKPVYKIIEI